MKVSNATGIKNVNAVADNNDDKVYNLNGQRVNGMQPKGVYIVNGKKIVK